MHLEVFLNVSLSRLVASRQDVGEWGRARSQISRPHRKHDSPKILIANPVTTIMRMITYLIMRNQWLFSVRLCNLCRVEASKLAKSCA